MTSRLHRLRTSLIRNGLDAAIISDDSNRRYVSGFTGSEGHLLVTQDDAILATDFRYVEQAKGESPFFEVIHIKGGITEWLPPLLDQAGAKRIGIESSSLTLHAYHQLVKAARKLPAQKRPCLLATQGLVESIRAVKEMEEMAAIEKAALLADAAETHAREILSEGMTERHMAWELEKFLRESGSESLPFDIIVASGANAAQPHAHPSNRQITTGEPIVIDLGARVDGYCSDITRTICLGEPSDIFIRIHRLVRQAQLEAIDKVRSGMSGRDADQFARQIIDAAGYGEQFGHGLGHGLGLVVHEKPHISQKSNDTLSEGMVFTIEPAIYVAGWGGIRIEDMILLGKEGARVLTSAAVLQL